MKTLVFLLLLSQSSVFGAERPEDFAYGMLIHADAQEALYEIEIPAAVYHGVTRADLGDVRVFNGQGEVVPHGLRPQAALSSDSGPAISLPGFPIHGEVTDKIEELQRACRKAPRRHDCLRARAGQGKRVEEAAARLLAGR